MAEKPDIRVLVGVKGEAKIDGESGQLILKQLNSIADQIKGEKAPKVTLSVDIDKTQSRLEKELRSIAKSIKNVPIDITFKSVEKEMSKSISQGVKKGIASYDGTDQIRALGKIYAGDRSKGNPIDSITKQLMSKDGVSNVGISGKNYFEGQKEQLKSFTATVTMSTGEVQKLNFELSKIGKRKGFVQTDSNSFKFNKSDEETKRQTEEIKRQTSAQKELNKVIKELEQIDSADLRKKFNQTSANLNQYTDKGEAANLIKVFEELRQKHQELNAELSSKSINEWAKDFIDPNATDEVKKFKGLINEFSSSFNDLYKRSSETKPLLTNDITSATNAKNLESFILQLSRYEKINDKFKGNSGLVNEFENIKRATSELKASGVFSDVDIKRLVQGFDKFKTSVASAGLEGQTAFSKLRTQVEKLGIYFSASAIMMGGWQQLKNITNNVIELDNKITDLQIATGYTRKETENLLNTYSSMGKEIGATTVEVSNAADAWLRQGYSISESNTLIKNSMMLSKLGQIDSAESTKALTSAMKGYKLSVEDSIEVVDKFTSLDMKAAVSAGYIATAMAETSTGARLAGIEMDRLAGYITTVGEVTQDGAESVGVFFKTLFARMGNIKEGKLIDPETQEDIKICVIAA